MRIIPSEPLPTPLTHIPVGPGGPRVSESECECVCVNTLPFLPEARRTEGFLPQSIQGSKMSMQQREFIIGQRALSMCLALVSEPHMYSFNPHNDPAGQIRLLFPFYRQETEAQKIR